MAVISEIERRVILFKPTTTMPDDSQLGYDADPNSASASGTDGEILLYNSPLGTQYIQSTGEHWRKTATPNTWTESGSGSGGSGTGNDVLTSQDTSACTLNYAVYESSAGVWANSDNQAGSETSVSGRVGICTAVSATVGEVTLKGDVTIATHGVTGPGVYVGTGGTLIDQPDTNGEFEKLLGWVVDANTIAVDVEEEYGEIGDVDGTRYLTKKNGRPIGGIGYTATSDSVTITGGTYDGNVLHLDDGTTALEEAYRATVPMTTDGGFATPFDTIEIAGGDLAGSTIDIAWR